MSVVYFSFLFFSFPFFLYFSSPWPPPFFIFPLTEEQQNWNNNHNFLIQFLNLKWFSFCFALQCKSSLTFWASIISQKKMMLNSLVGNHEQYQTSRPSRPSSMHLEKCLFFSFLFLFFCFYSQSKFHFPSCIKADGKPFEPSVYVKPLQ